MAKTRTNKPDKNRESGLVKRKTRVLKKKKDLDYENIFCIRENGKWVAGVYHARRTQGIVEDKKQEIAIMKLANELYIKLNPNERLYKSAQ